MVLQRLITFLFSILPERSENMRKIQLIGSARVETNPAVDNEQHEWRGRDRLEA